MIIVLIDSCVMVPVQLTNFFLRLAEAELLRPQWSPRVLADGIKATARARPDLSPELLARRFASMVAAFPEAMVTDFDDLTDPADSPDLGDLHVVAAAKKAQADVIVTYNLVDFPPDRLAPYGIRPLSPDDLACELITQEPGVVITVVTEQAHAMGHPAMTSSALIETLGSLGMPRFAAIARSLLP